MLRIPTRCVCCFHAAAVSVQRAFFLTHRWKFLWPPSTPCSTIPSLLTLPFLQPPPGNKTVFVTLCSSRYTQLPDPQPAPDNVNPDQPTASTAQYNGAVLAAVIIFFLTWGGNLFGVYFYCRENGLNFYPTMTAFPSSFFQSPLVFAFFLHGFVWIWLIKYVANAESQSKIVTTFTGSTPRARAKARLPFTPLFCRGPWSSHLRSTYFIRAFCFTTVQLQ
jgi:hypothetical protein